MKIHPAADLFPMMPDDELQSLSDDIKLNGLIHPIIIDKEGQLIDGRNRLRACELAGVKPKFENLNGQDPLAYIVSANLNRRNLSKGQQAMALAMIYPEEKAWRGKKSESAKVLQSKSISGARLSQARTVLRSSRELAESVLSGAMPLNAALEQVKEVEIQSTGDTAKLARLQKEAPDLAELFNEERLSLKEAVGALEERIKQIEIVKEAGRRSLSSLRSVDGHIVAVISAMDLGERFEFDQHILDRKVLDRTLEAYRLLVERIEKEIKK